MGGQPGQDNQVRTARTGQPELDNKTGKPLISQIISSNWCHQLLFTIVKLLCLSEHNSKYFTSNEDDDQREGSGQIWNLSIKIRFLDVQGIEKI